MKQKIKNIFKKPTKKALGKLGLFLVFGLILFIFFGAERIDLRNGYFSNNEARAAEDDYKVETDPITGAIISVTDSKGEEIYKMGDGPSTLTLPIRLVLNGLADAISQLIKVAGTLVDSVLSQDFFRAFVDNEGVYAGWVVVRDLLNMFFMMLLLFSAFATIFQVEKYHLRKVIIMLIVMALLVNFSFPIAIFIIDFSNSAMYFLIDATFSDNFQSKSAKIIDFTNFAKALTANYSTGSEVKTLILAVILNFLIFITLFAIGLNLLIRILAFVILLILAPVGFAFAFFPDTKGIANSWWSALLKYAFMGPIMVFFLYLAMSIFKWKGMPNNALNQIGEGAPSLEYFKFLIPIVFLWMGLIISQKFGGSGAGVAMNMAKKTGSKIKGYGQTLAWGGTKMVGKGFDNTVAGGRIGGTFGAIKNRWNQFGDDYKTKKDNAAANIGERIGVRGAVEKNMKNQAAEYKKQNIPTSTLENMARNGDAAAAYALADSKDMNTDIYRDFMSTNNNEGLRKAINAKTKQNRTDLVALGEAEIKSNALSATDIATQRTNAISAGARGATTFTDAQVRDWYRQQEVNNEINKMNAEKWTNQNWADALKRPGAGASPMDIHRHNSIVAATLNGWNNLTPEAKIELKAKLSGASAGALRGISIPV